MLTLVISLTALMLAYQSTLRSMVSTWSNSETYTHGFLILPLTAYLIWKRREIFANLHPRPDFWAVTGMLLAGLAWIIADLAEIQVIQQFFLVVQVILTIWAILGRKFVREMAFPLAFLFFSVPFGEFLIPGLVRFTADFTVGMIQLTGIPIYRDGNTFSLPTGNWSVAEACSGIRYLIASVTLGSLYAYLCYQSCWMRIAFIGFSLALPILANGLRAVMIVMIGHFSGMKLSVGIDHLIYGWLFFGIVMLFMFWIGSFWRDARAVDPDRPIQPGKVPPSPKDQWFVLAALLSLGSAAIWPVQASRMAFAQASPGPSREIRLPESSGEWRRVRTEGPRDWVPDYQGADREITASYSGSAGKPVRLLLYYYKNQEQGRELINSNNVVVRTGDKVWRLLEVSRIGVKLSDRSLPVNQWRLGSNRSHLLVWEWYWVGGDFAANDFLAKLLEAKAKLLGRNTDSAAIIVSVEYQDTVTLAADVLRRFVEEMNPSIEANLRLAARE
ncbi:MAG: exosortase A [Methylococcaceae bacterium]|nr:exosortase A [Methylococcaceae bacterium]MCI0733300.1 exosortase A [Methylococcaceae bacterium]